MKDMQAKHDCEAVLQVSFSIMVGIATSYLQHHQP